MMITAIQDQRLAKPGFQNAALRDYDSVRRGEWKTGGAGVTLRYVFPSCRFGTAIVIASDRGLAGLAFADPGEEPTALADMKRRSPNATYVADPDGTAGLAQRIFDTRLW